MISHHTALCQLDPTFRTSAHGWINHSTHQLDRSGRGNVFPSTGISALLGQIVQHHINELFWFLILHWCLPNQPQHSTDQLSDWVSTLFYQITIHSINRWIIFLFLFFPLLQCPLDITSKCVLLILPLFTHHALSFGPLLVFGLQLGPSCFHISIKPHQGSHGRVKFNTHKL